MAIALMYHDIISHDTAESGFQNKTALKYKVKAADFEKQVSYIRAYLDEKGLPSSSVKFTFDDGGVSFLSLAAPILERYNFKGIFFVSTCFIGTKGFLTAKQVKELAKRGHIVGSHSHSHPERMTILSKEKIKEEWQKSQDILESILGYRPKTASIPNGYSSKAIITATEEAGISEIYNSKPTTKINKTKSGRILGRYATTDEMSPDDILSIVSSKSKRLKISFKQKILNTAKLILGKYYLQIRRIILNRQ